jgi:hypothetical protein
MIAIRANNDIATSYLFAFSEEPIKEAETEGFKIARIEGNEISEATLRSRIKNRKPKFIFFSGHGSDTSLFDSHKKEFINIDSANVFKETVTYTIACSCLVKLGSAAIDNGCYAFIGYKKPFWIARDHKYESTPLKDRIAKPIIECSNVILKSLIKGNNVEESIKKSHEKATDEILKLIYSKEPLAPASLQALVYNDEALSFKGEASAKIA